MQFQRKLTNQTQENGKKPHFGPDLGPLIPTLACQFPFTDLSLSVNKYHGQLSSCSISEKTNDPILRKRSDGRMDVETDREKEERDFIGHCPTSVRLTSSVQK